MVILEKGYNIMQPISTIQRKLSRREATKTRSELRSFD